LRKRGGRRCRRGGEGGNWNKKLMSLLTMRKKQMAWDTGGSLKLRKNSKSTFKSLEEGKLAMGKKNTPPTPQQGSEK